jgi:hypothetical protein
MEIVEIHIRCTREEKELWKRYAGKLTNKNLSSLVKIAIKNLVKNEIMIDLTNIHERVIEIKELLRTIPVNLKSESVLGACKTCNKLVEDESDSIIVGNALYHKSCVKQKK